MTRPLDFNDLLARVHGVKLVRTGEARAPCPLPGHKTPENHLSIKDGGDKALVACQGGKHDFHNAADYQALCRLWGVDSLSYNKGDHEPEWRVTASFVYELEPGKEYYAIDRKENGSAKKFTVRQKVNGQYVFNMDGLSPILYRLPELRQAVKAGITTLIPEGEGKVDRLRALGFSATTNPFGAGKWHDSYNEALTGADVVILPDYDKVGLDFAEQKAKALHGIARRVRIVQLTDIEGLKKNAGKDGVDVLNWLDAGHSKEELQTLIDGTPDWKPSMEAKTSHSGFRLTPLAELLREPAEEIAYLWDNTLIKGGLSILVAKPKVGKSTLARNLAFAIAKGEPSFLGRNITTSGPVVYLALEEKRSEVRKHFERMGAAENLPIFIHTGSAPEQAIEELRKAVTEAIAVLAIVDPLQRLVRLQDMNDYSSVSLAFEPLMQIARDTGCHVLLIHHANKGIGREGGDSILGSTAIFASVDCALIMKRSESYRTVESIQRYGEDLPRTVLDFDVATGLTGSGGNLEDFEIAECKKAILDLLAEREMTEPEIRDVLTDCKGGVVSKCLRLLIQEGKINRQGLGKKGDPYRYSLAIKNARDSRDSWDSYIQIPIIPTIPRNACDIYSSSSDGKQVSHDAINSIETILGRTVVKAVEVWRAKGAPPIHLGPSEDCVDLAKMLKDPDVKPEDLAAVKAWLEKVTGQPGEAC